MTLFKKLAPLMCALLVVGCGDDNARESEYTPPSDYTFSSRTNTDFNSSVSNETAITQEFLKRELKEFINSSILQQLSAANVDNRSNTIYSLGTTVPTEGIITSLSTYNIYETGITSEPTSITNAFSNGLPFMQSNFSELPKGVNLESSILSIERGLPFKKLEEIEVDGEMEEVEVAEFIGWELLPDAENGDEMTEELISLWLSKIALNAADGGFPNVAIDAHGMHLDLLINELLQGAIFYSSITQDHLVSNKGLVSDNIDPVNLEAILEQEEIVEQTEKQLADNKVFLETQQATLDEVLSDWNECDSLADTTKEIDDYLFEGYHCVTEATAYYEELEDVEEFITRIENIESKLEQKKEAVEKKLPYTKLANTWDEAFGYFGAARNYGFYADEDIIFQQGVDENTDGEIDIFTELNFGFALLAAKIDANSVIGDVNFSKEIWDAFLIGRQIIQENYGRVAVENTGYHKDLYTQAEIIVSSLEKLVAAGIISQINLTVQNINDGETEVYSESYYKNWSILKGMALTLQFNDTVTIDRDSFTQLHNLIGESPIPDYNSFASRKTDLLNSRDILQQAYNFAPANVEAW